MARKRKYIMNKLVEKIFEKILQNRERSPGWAAPLVECCPVHQQITGSVPQSGHTQEAIDVSHIIVSLYISVSPSLPLSLKISKHVLG